MSAHRSWLGINPAMCLKDSDAPPGGLRVRRTARPGRCAGRSLPALITLTPDLLTESPHPERPAGVGPIYVSGPLRRS